MTSLDDPEVVSILKSYRNTARFIAVMLFIIVVILLLEGI